MVTKRNVVVEGVDQLDDMSIGQCRMSEAFVHALSFDTGAKMLLDEDFILVFIIESNIDQVPPICLHDIEVE